MVLRLTRIGMAALILSMLSPWQGVSTASASSGRANPAARPSAAPLDPSKLSFLEVATGLSQPVGIVNAGDGSGRLFIIERAGRIRILNKTGVLATSFLDITSIVRSTGGEEGLLALAFHPNYESNRYFYTVHNNTGGNLVLSRFTTSSTNANQAPASSRVQLLEIPHPTNGNHNGGTLLFGVDGYLYWSTGDGGGGGDVPNNAQNLNVLLGKILRLDVNSGSPYAIPIDNPFANDGDANTRAEIWAYGLRNPWRMAFDRLTHDLYIGDVGQALREEIDFEPAGDPGGRNYGWRVMEGTTCYNTANAGMPLPSCDDDDKVLPVAEYDHSGGNCSVTGGNIYRGLDYPSLQGHYFYADVCTGRFYDLRNEGSWVSTMLIDTAFSITAFGEDEDGEVYFTSYGTGRIYQIRYQETAAGTPPDNDDIGAPRSVPGIPDQDTLVATDQTNAAGDPSVSACNSTAGRGSVWYTYTPASSGEVYFDTFGSNYDTFLAVWTGSPGSLTPVACNDDDARSRLQSAVGFDATGGTTYYVEVGEWDRYLNGAAGISSMPSPDGLVHSDKQLVLHGTSFQDVVGTTENWLYIEALWRDGFTAGCSTNPLMFCPASILDRAQAAVFILRGQLGVGYVPPLPPWPDFQDDFSGSDISYSQKWAQGMWDEGFTAGCQDDPQLLYCPRSLLPRVEASVFGVRLMAAYGPNYNAVNTATTGTVFADMPDPAYFGTKWAELAYDEGLLPNCGIQGTQPLFCPNGLVNRGWAAYLIVKAKNLVLPTP